ncbi:hypothetical protein KIPB_015711 [Kipferlia bialata]|uniref:Uncharacterized protein n=1 Tax=Kipferlia bialata TaxID=797122 RepID=A0A391NUR4_9EUKA|nr:hypothetical protein KIPB_015711 [Kipferlia bialata]|eukprot:g15711.t1
MQPKGRLFTLDREREREREMPPPPCSGEGWVRVSVPPLYWRERERERRRERERECPYPMGWGPALMSMGIHLLCAVQYSPLERESVVPVPRHPLPVATPFGVLST